MSGADAQEQQYKTRWGDTLDRVETIYLKLLRAAVLIVATALIIFALWLGVSGLIKMSRSPDSVKEAETVVTADDLINAPVEEDISPSRLQSDNAIVDAATRNAYRDRLNSYYDIYRSRFEPYRQADDKQITRDEFDDQYLKTSQRAQSVAEGELDRAQDLADLDRLIAVMSEAASSAKTVEALQKYKAARKVEVRKTVDKVKTEIRSGWDSGSVSCEEWYLRPYGCPTARSVQVPYSEQVTVKEFPKGTRSHSAIFEAYHNQYGRLLADRREANSAQAAAERNEIVAGKIQGGASIWFAVQLVGAFLALMFFFLLIAIERHQRKLAA